MFVQIFKSRVRPENAQPLLEIRESAIDEAQRACPELLSAQLVRIDDETWLDILTWESAASSEKLMARMSELSLVPRMHALVDDVLSVDAGDALPA